MDQAIKHLSRKKFAISSTWSIFHEALNEPLKFIVLSFKATLSQTFLNFKVFKKKTLSTQFHDVVKPDGVVSIEDHKIFILK